jgi:hypothetical protein
MGVCCIKHHSQDPNEFTETLKKDEFVSLYAGNEEVIKKVVKIQSRYRIYKAKQVLADLKSKQTNTIRVDLDLEQTKFRSTNEKVLELEEKIGPFNYDKSLEINEKLEKKPICEVANGAKYFGQWNIETNKREGFGIQIWEDGSKYKKYFHSVDMKVFGSMIKQMGRDD